MHAERRAHHQRLRVEEEISDRCKVLAWIVGQFLEQELVVNQGLARQDADRVAVGLRFGASTTGDNEPAAGARIDDQWLADAAV